jgi:hypothetical protein
MNAYWFISRGNHSHLLQRKKFHQKKTLGHMWPLGWMSFFKVMLNELYTSAPLSYSGVYFPCASSNTYLSFMNFHMLLKMLWWIILCITVNSSSGCTMPKTNFSSWQPSFGGWKSLSNNHPGGFCTCHPCLWGTFTAGSELMNTVSFLGFLGRWKTGFLKFSLVDFLATSIFFKV